MWKLHLIKILVRKQVRNNHGLLILTPELWRKTKPWHKKYGKYQFCTERNPNHIKFQKIIMNRKSSIKNLLFEAGLSLKRSFGGCYGLGGFDGVGGFSGFDGLGGSQLIRRIQGIRWIEGIWRIRRIQWIWRIA